MSDTIHYTFSDADVDAERSAMRIEKQAYLKIEEAISLLKDAALLSHIKHAELSDYVLALNDTMADHRCSHSQWIEEIHAAREGE